MNETPSRDWEKIALNSAIRNANSLLLIQTMTMKKTKYHHMLNMTFTGTIKNIVSLILFEPTIGNLAAIDCFATLYPVNPY